MNWKSTLKGCTIWFTGLSGSGKTTIAEGLARKLRMRDISVVLLDGDEVRKTLSSDLGYKKEERDIHITRVANVSYLITKNDVICIVCVISPTKRIRDFARTTIKNFIEVYTKCPISVCMKRDIKGHYKKVKNGEIKDFVGINIPYEEPEKPEIILETHKESVNESIDRLLQYLELNGII